MKKLGLVGLVVLGCAAVVACGGNTADDGSTGANDQNLHPSEGEPTQTPPPPSSPSADPPVPSGPPATPGCQALPAPTGGVNPAAQYCRALGFPMERTTSPAGESYDCVLPSGERCDEWAFYRGECGHAFSFCEQHGGKVANVVEDRGGWTASFARCTLPDGHTCEDARFATTCKCE